METCGIKYYIYKLTFSSGATYIGSHIQKKENDGYITSSRYVLRHKGDKIIKREILLFCDDAEQMNIMETICIISDKCNSKNNVNGNYGNWLHNFHSSLDYAWNKGIKMSAEFCEKISEREREPIVCLETNEVFQKTTDIKHASEVINKKRNSCGGLHYRKLTKEDENVKILENKNKELLREIYKNKVFYLFENKAYLKKINNYEKKIDYDFILKNNLEMIYYKQKPKGKVKVLNVETNEIFDTIKQAEEKYNCFHISEVINGIRNICGGYHWIKIS